MKRSFLALFAALVALSAPTRSETMREKSLQLVVEDAKPRAAQAPIESRAKPPRLKPFEEVEPEIVKLPEVKVEAEKVTVLDARLASVERQQQREEKASSPTWLDSFLNSSMFSFLGGASAEARAAQARWRVDIMDSERLLLVSSAIAKTPEERKRIQEDIQMLKDIRR
jgi:hypothetical protein